MTEKITVIIQARFGASRLPGKVLLPLAGKSVLEHVIMRVSRSSKVSGVMVATSVGSNDGKISEKCEALGIPVYRGSEEDVLDRFYQASMLSKPDHVVRITADCPMIDPAVIDKIIDEHIKNNTDYTSNTISPTYPDGEDVEVFKKSALEKAWKNAKLSSEREHVTPYIRNNPRIFKLLNIAYVSDLSAKRWTLDEEKDYRFLAEVFEGLYPADHFFGMDTILKFLRDNPNVEKINSDIMRNEGYQKSLKNDKVIK
jgi:spore coat polysaccharide biosynthesis protein SpsF